MQDSVASYLMCQWANASPTPVPPVTCQNDTVDNWVSRVVLNGGSAPSDNTKNALCMFMNSLDSEGITPKIKAMCCLVPDNLIAAVTPLIVGLGADPWTNHNFVDADLTIDGLKGNGINKYLTIGLAPSLNFSATSAGVTIYVTQIDLSFDALEVGASDNVNQLIMLCTRDSGSKYIDWDCFNNTLGAGRIHVINPGGFLGYYSGNRTAANATAIYLANSSTPHYVAASAATSGGSPGARVLTAFVLNSSSGLAGYSRQRLSFIAAHSGLTESESAVFNGLIYKMRHDIGGGYV